MNASRQRQRRGFTLIELSLAMLIGLMTCATLMTIFQVQLTFLDVMNRQNFLMDEAPMVSLNASKIIGQAERYRMYNTLTNARANANQVAPDAQASVLALQFRRPDGAAQLAYLEFNDATDELAYYPDGQDATRWVITRQAANVRFFQQNGVLRMQLTGTNGEQITFAGAMQK